MSDHAIVVVIFSSAVGLMVVIILALHKCESVGYRRGVEAMQKDAVESEHGEYYLDENNTRQWRWKREPAP